MVQYINALELYRDAHPDEGYPHEGSQGTQYCIGPYSADGECMGTQTYNQNMSEKIGEFIPGPPEDTNTMDFSGFNLMGTSYACTNISNNNFCSNSVIYWYMFGNNQDCGRGYFITNVGNFSACAIEF